MIGGFEVLCGWNFLLLLGTRNSIWMAKFWRGQGKITEKN
jgi:hypothetical protein